MIFYNFHGFPRKSDNPLNIIMAVFISLWLKDDDIAALWSGSIIYNTVYKHYVSISKYRLHGITNGTDLLPKIPD